MCQGFIKSDLKLLNSKSVLLARHFSISVQYNIRLSVGGGEEGIKTDRLD